MASGWKLWVWLVDVAVRRYTSRVSRIFGKGGKCRVGTEEGGMLAALAWPLEGGLGVFPHKILDDLISCHLN